MQNENSSFRLRNNESEISETPDQPQSPQHSVLGVERGPVDEEFAMQIPAKKNNIIDTLKEQSFKYQHLPAPIRYAGLLFVIGLIMGFVCMIIREFIAGGVLLGSFFCFSLAVNRIANNNKIKLDRLNKAEGQVAVLEGQVVSPDNSGHFRNQEGRDPKSLEEKFLTFTRVADPQLMEPESTTAVISDGGHRKMSSSTRGDKNL